MTKKIDYKKKFEDFKKALIDEYEDRFDDFKQNMAERFSDFVDAILEDEMEIPEKVIKYAKCGELYQDLIKELQKRLGVDQGLVDGETKDLMKDAKQEILAMRNRIDSTIGETLEIQKDAKEMAAQLYIWRYIKKYNLPDDATLEIFRGAISKNEIDKKMKVLLEGPVASARDELAQEIKDLKIGGIYFIEKSDRLEKENSELHRILHGIYQVK